jgi:hypothetical protein
MIKYFLMYLFLCVVTTNIHAKTSDVSIADPSVEGRWDLKLYGDQIYPSWLEITHSGNNTLIGQFVAIVGSARPISKVNYSNGKVSFSIPPQWESG